MTVLYIAACLPYPREAANLIYHWLEAAQQKHEVHLLVVGDSRERRSEIPELPNVRVEILRPNVGRSLSQRISRFVNSAARGIPPTSLVCMAPEARQRVLEQVKKYRYDAVVLAENVVAGYARIVAPAAPVVLFKHSVQAVDARDARRRCGWYHPRWIVEESSVQRFESGTCRAATVVCCVNSEDAAELSRRYQLAEPAEVVPIGVDVSRFPCRRSDPGGKTLGFHANLTWGANLDAALWFASEILPKIWKEHPDARFRIIGPGSERLRLRFRDPRVVSVGPVPQAMIPKAMEDVAVGVVPVVSGTGVRLKLLEMLSMGIPTVSTSLGRLGTGCVHWGHILVADDANAFAQAVCLLLSDPGLRHRLSRRAAELSRALAWVNSYPKILDVLELAVRRYALRAARARAP